MKKIIYTLLCICFFTAINAQTNDIQAANAFIKKVHDRVSQIKAAEFLVKRTYPQRTGESSPYIKEVKGFFKVVPDDKAAGCNYFIESGFEKKLYNGKNKYDYTFYEEGSLDIADTKKYPEQAKLEYMNPNPFQDLLNTFEEQFGQTAEEAEHHFKEDGMKVKISVEEKDNKTYHLLSYEFDPKNHIVAIATIYVTKDFLPEKIVIKSPWYGNGSASIENYTLLDDIPDNRFSISLLGEYTTISHYEGPENGYVIEEKKNK